MITQPTPAEGQQGTLLLIAPGTYVFRVPDIEGGYQDFEIMPTELQVTINSTGLAFNPAGMSLDQA